MHLRPALVSALAMIAGWACLAPAQELRRERAPGPPQGERPEPREGPGGGPGREFGPERGGPPVELPQTWSTRDGKTFAAELIAADGLRATFQAKAPPATATGPAGAPRAPVKFVVALAELAARDAETIRAWRAADWRTPLADPERLAPWPAQAGAEGTEVRLTAEEAGTWTYESADFRLTSDLKLPLSAVRDLATVLEATRAVLIAMPLGLHAGGEREKYSVLLFGTGQAYAAAGGPAGSGGFYEGRTRRMLVLLPNLGIEEKGGAVQLKYGRSLFVLKHEVTHQLLARWQWGWPRWLSEGLAEFVASLPYQQGRYQLQNPGTGMRDYLLKWRKAPDDRTVRLVPATQLMAMGHREWLEAVAGQSAYDLYNSAALLVWSLIQDEGGAPLVRYLAGRRRGEDDVGVLRHGRSREQLDAQVALVAKKMGLEVRP